MSRIPAGRKEAILKKLLPPYSMSVSELSRHYHRDPVSLATTTHTFRCRCAKLADKGLLKSQQQSSWVEAFVRWYITEH
ncbi:hypothetical protein [Vibrio natriegens]|uniref:hypothetical protein n=1 Tax=Vibrio natriegens TaxID=691 RepID=UPI000AB7A1D1|nr:hypothetical protein [Vibrio natriegens]